ncbi:MAG: asparagine synthetase B, partial [Moorella sp. (in: Bacteria)]|nr:asparagine synthetase B [Moorella sp. (in: firmicutes)]
RLNGIFAFAIWGKKDQALFLARDRLGVKPLFYAQAGQGLVFASELKGLLAHPAVEPRLGAEGLSEVLVMGPGRTPGHGIFEEVYELKPGHWLLFDRGGTRQGRYWTLTSHPHTDDLKVTVGRVRELLQDAVQRQLVSDVPICTLLSGGLDSSAVTAFAAAAYRAQGRT